MPPARSSAGWSTSWSGCSELSGGEWAFAADDQAASAALRQGLLPGEVERQNEHDPPILAKQDNPPKHMAGSAH